MTKMTNVKALEFVLTNCADLPSEVTEKLTAMKSSFEKKSSAYTYPAGEHWLQAGDSEPAG